MSKRFLSGINVIGGTTLNGVTDAGVDTDKFIVLDSNGVVKYRTGDEILSDVGAVSTARTLSINGTSYDLSADRSWTISTSSSARSIQKFVATANQTTFTITGGYTVGLVDVYVNGVKLDNSGDFTATNGSTIVLTTGTLVNNIVEVYKYINAFTANNALRVSTYFTATAGQTTFAATYSLGLIDVFYNGSKLATSEYNASSGTSIVFNNACSVNDIIEIIAYNYSVGGFTGVSQTRTITINGTAYDLSADRAWTIDNTSLGAQPQLNGTGLVRMTGTTVSYDNATYATQSYVTTAVANLVDAAPSTLDTLNELAAALGDDPNFATTIATSIGTKQPQLNGTGFVKISGTTISYDTNTYLTTASASSTYLPLVGGTLTGVLNGTSGSFSSTITLNDVLRLKSSSYGANYNTSLRSDTSACGILQFGNNNDNYILVGNTAAGGYLDIRVNCASESITAGTLALRLASTGAATFSSSITSNYTYNGGGIGMLHLTSNGTEGGSITLEKTSGTAQKYKVGNSGTSFFIYNETAGNQPFTLLNNGSTGIGYDSPVYQLQVLNTIGLRANSQNIQAIKGTGWGYSPTTYKVVMLGDTANNVTVSIGYDPSGNANGAFSGAGGEVLFRNGVSFATPTAANTAFHLNTLVLKDGSVGIGTGSPIGPLDIAAPAVGSSIAATTSQQAYNFSRLRIKHYTDSNLGLSIGYAGANWTYMQACYNEGSTAPLLLNPFGGDVRIGTSGLKFSNGSTNLNYYEEGTWTPVLTGTGGGDYTTSAGNSGKYTRVGNVVTITCTLVWSGGGSYSGNLSVKGIPFTNGGNRCHGSMGAISSGLTLSAGYYSWSFLIDPGASFVYIIQNSSNGYSHGPSVGSSGTIYAMTITYLI